MENFEILNFFEKFEILKKIFKSIFETRSSCVAETTSKCKCNADVREACGVSNEEPLTDDADANVSASNLVYTASLSGVLLLVLIF